MIVGYIDAYRDRFGVVPICGMLTEHGMPTPESAHYERKRTPVSAGDCQKVGVTGVV